MSEKERDVRVEGIVRARSYDPAARGKQFLGAIIEGADGMEWVVSYAEQSPFHVFADRQVEAFGMPDVAKGQHLIGALGGRSLAHFKVSRLRLAGAAPGAELSEVGAEQSLFGGFKRDASDALYFVTRDGDTFRVVNDPAGATTDRDVEVLAYRVQPSVAIPGPAGQHLWVICPHSAEDLWEWRRRRA